MKVKNVIVRWVRRMKNIIRNLISSTGGQLLEAWLSSTKDFSNLFLTSGEKVRGNLPRISCNNSCKSNHRSSTCNTQKIWNYRSCKCLWASNQRNYRRIHHRKSSASRMWSRKLSKVPCLSIKARLSLSLFQSQMKRRRFWSITWENRIFLSKHTFSVTKCSTYQMEKNSINK